MRIGDFFAYFKKSEKKRIYFVRHGETLLNSQHIRQGAEGGLTEKGKKQASLTAERLKTFPIDVIVSSPFERTRETAAIVSSIIKKNVEYSSLLAERRNPSEIIGKWADDPDVRRITDLIDKGFHEGNLRYSDEENYEDLKKRAEELLDFLAQKPEKNILCVTHGIFLTMVISVIQYRDALTPAAYTKLSFYNKADNAGITVCEYDPGKKNTESGGWSLLVWNDYSRQVK